MNVTAIGMDSNKMNLEALDKKRLDKKKMHNHPLNQTNLADSFNKAETLQKKK